MAKMLFKRTGRRSLGGDKAPLPQGAKCEICGFTRALQRAHILPVRFLLDITNVDADLLHYQGRNVIILCANHHFLFDHFQLTPEELVIIWDKVYERGMEFCDLLARVQHTSGDERLTRRKRDSMMRHVKKYGALYV